MKKLLFIVSLLFIFSCSKDELQLSPIIETKAAVVLGERGVSLVGEIHKLRYETNYGFVISDYKGGTTLMNNNMVINKYGTANGEYSIDYRNGLVEGKTYYFNAFVAYDGDFLFGEEKSFVSNGSASPIITEVIPSIAHVGDTINIEGKYFSKDFKLYFNDKEAEVLFKTDTLTKAIVPFDYYREEPYNRLSLKKSTGEITFFNEFSMFIPEVISVEPYYAYENDTIRIIGKHFNLENEQNRLSMGVFNDYSNIEILESSRTEIKFVNTGWFYELYPRMRLKSQFQTLDFNDKFQAKLPNITGVSPTCMSYGENITVYGEDFPRTGTSFNSQFSLSIGGVNFSAVTISRDHITLNVEDNFYTDFLLEDIVIEYLGETITYEIELCVDEPWIKVSFDNPQHQPHNYQNETYGVVSQSNNTFLTVGKLNTDNYHFESVLNEQLPVAIRYGKLRAWHENKLYHYSTSPTENKFYGYNFLNGTLEELSPFPGAQRVNGLMACVGDYIYLGLGRSYTYEPFDDIWRYSIAEDTWEFVLTYPGINTNQDAITDPLTFVFEDRLFFGGINGNNQSNLFWELDLNTFALLPKANVPIPSAHGLKGATIGTKGYFESFYLYEYDLLNDQWLIHEDIQGIGFLYPNMNQSLFTHNGNLFRSITTSSPYYKLLFKMNMNYLE